MLAMHNFNAVFQAQTLGAHLAVSGRNAQGFQMLAKGAVLNARRRGRGPAARTARIPQGTWNRAHHFLMAQN